MKTVIPFILVLTMNLSGICNNSSYVNLSQEESKSIPQLVAPKCYEDVIDTCFFTIYEDCDGDSYPNWRWLVVDFTDIVPSESVYLKVWLKSGENYYLLTTTDVFSFPRPRYSFKVYGTKHLKGEVIVVLYDSKTGEELHNYWQMKEVITIESPEEDLHLEIGYCDWASFGFIDNDGDGYFSQHRLHLNINSCPESHSVYFKASARKQPASENPCWYYTSPVYTTDITGEILYMIFGGENGGLSHGEYKIDLQVFDANTHKSLTKLYPVEEGMKFELPEEDMPPPVSFVIRDAHFGDQRIDMDLDGYNRLRDLNFMAAVSSGSYDVTAKISYKKQADEEFHFYSSTKPFAVTSGEKETHKIFIGGENPELPHAIYEFKIELFLGTQLVAEKTLPDKFDEKAQWFETSMEDEAFKMAAAYWSKTEDWDGDNFASYRELTVEFDVYAEPVPVYINIMTTQGENEVSLYTSEVFTPSALDPIHNFDIPGESFFYGIGTVYLYKASTKKPINTIYGLDVRFEKPEDDMVYSIKSTEWAEGTDYDLDEYFSYRKLVMDIYAAPLKRSLKMEVSMCKKPIMAGPCPYIVDHYFQADSTSNDLLSIDLGLPNTELDSGGYQFDVYFFDSITGKKVLDYTYVDGELKMEPLSRDPYKFSFLNVRLSDDYIDMDQDFYSPSRNLSFDITVTGGLHSVYTILYYQQKDETEFNEYYTTLISEVTSDLKLHEVITIGAPNNQITHEIYNLKLAVFNADNDERLVVLLPEDKRALNEQRFETVEQDYSPLPQSEESLLVINETMDNADVSVFPNPFDNVLSLSLNSESNNKYKLIRLFDSKGVLIREEKLADRTNTSTFFRIDNLEEIQAGIYILEIQSIDTAIRFKLVKQ